MRIEYKEAPARLLFGSHQTETSPIIWIGKPHRRYSIVKSIEMTGSSRTLP